VATDGYRHLPDYVAVRILNVHERELAAPAPAIGTLISF
jgi:hypothetical protein